MMIRGARFPGERVEDELGHARLLFNGVEICKYFL